LSKKIFNVLAPGVYLLQSILYTALVLMLNGCANIILPTGGDADKTPPVPLQAIPDSASVNFKSETVTLIFNENIQLKDIGTQFLISPPTETEPVFKGKKKNA
jgi:hypothetical protein